MFGNESRAPKNVVRPFFGYVLAGGFSRRFGTDKALVELAAVPMLTRTLTVLSASLTKNVFVIGAPEKYQKYGACIADTWLGEGPLGGIITALEHSRDIASAPVWNLILSCDMPFLTPQWLTFLLQRAAQSQAQAVYAHSAQGPEPLCACWRTDAASTLRAAFESGTRKVTAGIALLRSEVLDAEDWKRFDSAGRLFWNMNTVQDYEDAKRILEAKDGGAAQDA